MTLFMTFYTDFKTSFDMLSLIYQFVGVFEMFTVILAVLLFSVGPIEDVCV